MAGGAALTIATLGAAGPIMATIMVVGLVSSTAVEVNDLIAEKTGTNFIKDKLCAGSALCYQGIELGTTALSLIGPGGAGHAAELAAKTEDLTKIAAATRKADNALDDIAAAGRLEDTTDIATTATKTGKTTEITTTGTKTADTTGDIGKTGGTADTTTSAGPSCLLSFTTATLVLMADGTHKPIGDVKVDDRVMSYDPGTNTQSVQTVTAIWPHDDTIVTLTLSDGTTVQTTDAHPWWNVTTRTYTRTDHLAKGDQVLTADGTTLTVSGLSGPQGTQPVTNLTVTGPHTYYVTDTSILVHNCPLSPSDAKKLGNLRDQAD